MCDWLNVTLGDIFDISSSKRVLQSEWKPSGVPFYRAREIVKLAKEGAVSNELFISEELYKSYSERYGAPQTGDLMISAVGTLGACYVVKPTDRFYFKDASVLRLKAKQEICPSFFLHAFRTSELLDQVHSGSGSTVGTYTIERAKATRIRVPPIPEQRRIAAILDQVDALRAKRREALGRLDKLAQAIFVEMFGDPKSNKKGWRMQRLGDLVHKITDGEHINPVFSSTGMPMVMAGNVLEERIDVANTKKVDFPLGEKFRKKCNPEIGDLLVVSRGATIGRMCPVRVQDVFCLMGSVILIKLDTSLLITEFVTGLLKHPVMRGLLYKTSGSSAQQAIYLKDLKSLPFIVPPIELQREFSERLGAIERAAATYRVALRETDNLFCSLQHRAFRGEL